jgi:hypothetical protein
MYPNRRFVHITELPRKKLYGFLAKRARQWHDIVFRSEPILRICVCLRMGKNITGASPYYTLCICVCLELLEQTSTNPAALTTSWATSTTTILMLLMKQHCRLQCSDSQLLSCTSTCFVFIYARHA